MKISQMKARTLVVRPQELKGLKNHQDEALPAAYGPRIFHLGETLVPGADVFITSRTISALAEPAEPNVEPHRHSVSQTYLIFGADGGLEIQVEIDGEKITALSPAAIFIPAGATHSIQVLRGTGTLMSVFRAGSYD